MAIEINTAGVVGTDNQPPVYDPNGLFKVWALPEVYTGGVGENRYVPKVHDLVFDPAMRIWYIVDQVDAVTLIPKMSKLDKSVPTTGIDDTDLLLGVGPGTVSDTFRVYLNKNVLPYTLTVDRRLRVHGSECVSAKIWRGSELTGNAKVVSKWYDQSGSLLGQSIPLELVATEDVENKSIKVVPVCYTSEDMPNGELVTVVFYSATGGVVSKAALLVEDSSYTVSPNAAVKYITGISLKTPFLSKSDPKVVKYPMNVPLIGLSLVGVVHYSDGSSKEMAVDGGKFSMFGFDGFVSTIIGQTLPLVLNYQLSRDELVYGTDMSAARSITESYKAIVDKAEGMYTPKLYGYPVWVNEISGYRLEWWLYDLDRNLATLVTPYVKISNNSAPWGPLDYGTKQTLRVEINLRSVHPSGLDYIHTQIIDIVLRQPGTSRSTNWAIGFDPHQAPYFGENNAMKTTFINSGLTRVDITCGETVLEAWLTRMYKLTKPLTDPSKEGELPMPNYFSICGRDWNFDYPISQWNAALTLSRTMPDNDTVFIKFFQRTPDADIQLSIAAMPTYQQN